MFFLGGNFVSSLTCTLKSKKAKKKPFLKKPGFFQPWSGSKRPTKVCHIQGFSWRSFRIR